MASSARAPSTDGARLGCSDADGLASKVAVFESLAAEFPHLLNAEGQALLAAAHDGRLSEAVLAAAADGHAAVEAAAPGTPSPTKPDAPPARPEPLEHDTPSPPPPPPAARTKGLGSEDFAQPALAVPPACAAPPPSAAQLVDAARPVAAWTGRRWCATLFNALRARADCARVAQDRLRRVRPRAAT